MLVARHPVGYWVGPRNPPPPMLNRSRDSRRHTSHQVSPRSSHESRRSTEDGRSWPRHGLSNQHQTPNVQRAFINLDDRLDPQGDDRHIVASSRHSESEGDRDPLDPHFNPLSQRQLQPNVSGSEFPSTAQTRAARPLRRRPHQQVLSACSNCKKDHLSCDTSRPCNRCVSTNKQATCRDVPPKKRGRPRLRESPGALPHTSPRKKPKNSLELNQGKEQNTHPGPGPSRPGLNTRPGSEFADLIGDDASGARLAPQNFGWSHNQPTSHPASATSRSAFHTFPSTVGSQRPLSQRGVSGPSPSSSSPSYATTNNTASTYPSPYHYGEIASTLPPISPLASTTQSPRGQVYGGLYPTPSQGPSHPSMLSPSGQTRPSTSTSASTSVTPFADRAPPEARRPARQALTVAELTNDAVRDRRPSARPVSVFETRETGPGHRQQWAPRLSMHEQGAPSSGYGRAANRLPPIDTTTARSGRDERSSYDQHNTLSRRRTHHEQASSPPERRSEDRHRPQRRLERDGQASSGRSGHEPRSSRRSGRLEEILH